MIRNLILALAASLLPCAAFAQAQTPMLTVATPLKANSGDQDITLTSKRAPFIKGDHVKLCPVTSATPASSYVRKADTCPTPVVVPVKPPTPTSPATGVVTLSGVEAFILTDQLAIGINEGGGFGSITNAPASYDLGSGYARLGIGLRDRKTDLTILGANVEGFSAGGGIAGKRVLWRNLRGVGRMEMPGSFAADGTWTGQANGLRIEQHLRADGKVITADVRLTNTGRATIADLRYLRTADFDDRTPLGVLPVNTLTATANKVIGKADVQSGLLGRGKPLAAFLRSDDATATATIGGFINEDPFAVPSLAASTADASVNLVWQLGDLAPGASVSLSFQIGVR